MDAAVHLVLRDSNPNGVVIATRDNWTGRAIALPIADLLAKKEPLSTAGVYVLVGVMEDGAETPTVYVGEAEEIAERVTASHKQLQSKQVTWQRAVVFVSTGGDLNKAHIKWLESTLISLGRAAKRVHLSNGTTPTPPALSEPDEVFVRSFLANMLVIYPLLRVNAFDVPVVPAVPAATKTAGDPGPTEGLEVYLHRGRGKARKVVATGRTTASGGLVLLPGSLVKRKAAEHVGDAVVAHRTHLQEAGALTAHDDEWWELTSIYEISSPSTAATVVSGSAVNGLLVWKDAKGEKSLAELLSPTYATGVAG